MGVTGAKRRLGAAAAATLLALPLAGVSVGGVAAGVGPRGPAAVAPPLIEAAPGVVAFSPNGDGRRDRARLRFTLGRPARVRVTVRDDDGLARAPVRLGRLPAGRHDWTWDGRTHDSTVAADGPYEVTLRAASGSHTESATATVLIDTVRPQGRLITTRPTAYPRASVVEDRVELLWLADGWNPWDAEMGDTSQQALSRLEIRTRAGDLVWRRVVRNRYTPVFQWYARRDGRALPAGRYVARVVVADAAGNQRRDRRHVRVSHARLVEEVWTVSVPAARAGRYRPYFGGCNGCGESCDPVASARFPDGLSFRPCTESWQWGAAEYFGSGVPFAVAPADSYRVTATGGPTVPGSPDQGHLDGTPIGPGDASATTRWQPVDLSGDPYLPARQQPVVWTFTTLRPSSYDLASFTVEYRHYVPAGSLPRLRWHGGGTGTLSPRRR